MPRRSSIFIACSIDGCNNNMIARGLCRMHYYRWKRTGTTNDPTVTTPVERFWLSVDKNGPIHPVCGQCWIWTRGNVRGYGKIAVDGKSVTISRYSWTLEFGPIDNGMCVLHKCDNPSCVNPNHLFLGTDIDNIRDRDGKGRQVRGERQHVAKLTEQIVLEIRTEYRVDSSTHGCTALAAKYGVSHQTILRVIHRRTWKYI